MSQTIDPAVFTDDDGKVYLLFGNGYPGIVQLNDDMVSLKEDSMRQIIGAEDFREAIMVIKKDGIYHFTWSCDDTGSEDYHVNYGTSDSIYGPIEFKYAILSKDLKNDILGTGHHSILNINNTNEYYIAYHRFATPLENYPDQKEKGFHREVCLDKLEFNAEGLLRPVRTIK